MSRIRRNGWSEALAELYAWYRSTGTMLDALIRDQSLVPSVGQRFGGFYARLAAAQDLLMAGRRLRGRKHAQVRATIGLALKIRDVAGALPGRRAS